MMVLTELAGDVRTSDEIREKSNNQMSTLSKFQIQALQRSLIRTAGTLSRIALIRGLYTKYGKVMTQCADDCKRREEQHASERNTALLNVDVSGHIVKPIW